MALTFPQVTKSLTQYRRAWPQFRLDRREADRLALTVGADVGGNSSTVIRQEMSQQGVAIYDEMRTAMLAASTPAEINEARLQARKAFLEIDYSQELPR